VYVEAATSLAADLDGCCEVIWAILLCDANSVGRHSCNWKYIGYTLETSWYQDAVICRLLAAWCKLLAGMRVSKAVDAVYSTAAVRQRNATAHTLDSTYPLLLLLLLPRVCLLCLQAAMHRCV
jgi:hypothetical protein